MNVLLYNGLLDYCTGARLVRLIYPLLFPWTARLFSKHQHSSAPVDLDAPFAFPIEANLSSCDRISLEGVMRLVDPQSEPAGPMSLSHSPIFQL